MPSEPSENALRATVGGAINIGEVPPDYALELPTGATGSFSSVTGTFEKVSHGAEEPEYTECTGSDVPPCTGRKSTTPNDYSLQLNTSHFNTSVCSGSTSSGCEGWQQFVYMSAVGFVYIEYWLLDYVNPTNACPPDTSTVHWQREALNALDCVGTGAGGSLPKLGTDIPKIDELQGSTFQGTVATHTTASYYCKGNVLCDEVKFINPTRGEAVGGAEASALKLAGHWTGEEWGIYGPGDGTEADFTANTHLSLKTEVEPGSLYPVCRTRSYTLESNNLELQTSPGLELSRSGDFPTDFTDEESSNASTPACSASAKWGDTHIQTFGCNTAPSPPPCLFYDFQASGNFVAATTGPNFTVQTHQVSGAPTWPLAAVNQGVATKVGDDDVAVCTPQRLAVNGRTQELASGEHRNLDEQGEVARYGNVYVIRQDSGNSVRAEVNSGNPSWINVSVGLGEWPTTVHGLDATPKGKADAIETRGGTVLSPSPYVLSEFYKVYGESWRVRESESLLGACDEKPISENPSKPFYASELESRVATPARKVCAKEGVDTTALLEACTLDVAVLGEDAAIAYRQIPTDVNVAKICRDRNASARARYTHRARRFRARRKVCA